MIEGFAREMPEDRMAEAIATAHELHPRRSARCRKSWPQKAGAVKKPYEVPPPDALFDTLQAKYYDAFRAAKQTEGKQARAEACAALKEQAVGRVDSRSEGRGRRSRPRRSPRRGRSWRRASSAT